MKRSGTNPDAGIKARMREHLQAQRLPLTELAERTGIAYGNVVRWVNGETAVPAQFVADFVRVVPVDPLWLLTGGTRPTNGIMTAVNPAAWLRWLEGIPSELDDAHPVPVPAGVLRALAAGAVVEAPPAAAQGPPVVSWRERLWTAPEDTRIGVEELVEALPGKSRDWVYKRTSEAAVRRRAKAGNPVTAPLPFRKLDGVLEFRVGDVRAWLEAVEEVGQVAPP